ncbi:YhcN/YlaJ family sporulation lipoprotein [Bacillus sp. SL00103]
MKILQVKPSDCRIVMKEIIPTCQKQTQTEQGMFVIKRQQVTDQKERTPALNREHLAHVITSLTVQLPNIKDANTLVTDEDALIVYRTGNKNRDESADQVKEKRRFRSPRYYHVYVSDNPEHFQSIANFHVFKPIHVDFDQILTKTIQQMKYSPRVEIFLRKKMQTG